MSFLWHLVPEITDRVMKEKSRPWMFVASAAFLMFGKISGRVVIFFHRDKGFLFKLLAFTSFYFNFSIFDFIAGVDGTADQHELFKEGFIAQLRCQLTA